ncbi:MAG: 2-oxoacid:ferredoxin oxidoreductase subunit beta, partial [Ignavibacteriae bacterium]|nr:2-oxoacid:ferredoxin oxidoreductase subunit beta [Ignavibacteriota bacterium]
HKGLAFIEVYQNCPIFNDGTFSELTEKDTKEDNVVILEHGKPMVFGKNKEKGIKLEGFHPVIVDLNDPKNSIDDCLVHNEKDDSLIRGFILAHLTDSPDMPTPIGVFRQRIKPTYDEAMVEQIDQVTKKKGKGSLEKLLFTQNTWEVK